MKWVKKSRILEPPSTCDWMVSHAVLPTAERIEDDLYRIYFAGRDKHNRSHPGYILIDINRPSETIFLADRPILECGPPGNFDDSGIMPSWVVDYQNTKYVYYAGWNRSVSVPFRNAMGLAISTDGGKTFRKYAQGPILDRSIHDPSFVGASCVLIENKLWRMWYLSCIGWELEADVPKHRYHIKYAESEDGIHWARNGVVCIDFKSSEEYAISRPSVLKEDGLYKMWYSYRGRSYRIGYAESTDGLHWERRDHEAGIDVSESGWDSEMIEYPFVFDHKGERYMLYNGNGYGKTGIGLAVLER